MVHKESDCVGCGFPCNYSACPHFEITILECDKCGREVDELYLVNYPYPYLEQKQFCEDCALEFYAADKISCYDCYEEFDSIEDLYEYDGKYYCKECLLKQLLKYKPE